MPTPSYAPVTFLRDVDGTGSLHPCGEGDPGAIAYVPAETKEEVAGVELWPTYQELNVDFENV